MTDSPRYWLVIPAAGIGARLQSDIPKQYLPLANNTVIETTLSHFIFHPRIEKIFVALQPDDTHWQALSLSHHEKIETVDGGNERHESVFNALKVIKERANQNDFVLVHDAARPCVTIEDIDRLIVATQDHPVGGLLGVPISDTVKMVDFSSQQNNENREDLIESLEEESLEDRDIKESRKSSSSESNTAIVRKTIDRKTIWTAYTPQLFRFEILYDALRTLVKSGTPVTDESMAVEYAGYQPLMVEGRRDNLKITVPGDLQLAEKIISERL